MPNVTITGKFQRPDGTPLSGVVMVVATPGTVLNAAGRTVFAGSVTEKLDGTGSFALSVPASDDASLNPKDFTYRLTPRLTGGSAPEVVFAAPASTPTLDYADLAPVSASSGIPTVVGPAGPATTLTVGTVTTGAPGSVASASIRGEAPQQVLDLSIPAGAPGAPAPATTPPIAYDTDGTPYLTI